MQLRCAIRPAPSRCKDRGRVRGKEALHHHPASAIRALQGCEMNANLISEKKVDRRLPWPSAIRQTLQMRLNPRTRSWR